MGRTVDELTDAWANMPGFNATAAIAVIVDGFSGKQIESTVPSGRFVADRADLNEILASTPIL